MCIVCRHGCFSWGTGGVINSSQLLVTVHPVCGICPFMRLSVDQDRRRSMKRTLRHINFCQSKEQDMRLNHIVKSVAFAVFGAVTFSAAVHAAEITGAGSSFVYPGYSKWAESYKEKTGNNLNYQSIGSGGGIKQIKAKTVDFGASDAPLSQAELDADGLTQFPAVVGGVVPVINLDGTTPGQVKLSGQVLGDIYSGKITKWNAPEIAALNPGVKLPAEDITVVYRSDGSGTSFVFTSYLSKANADFKSKIGAGTAV